ncbi:polysaccharide pyruvyl transferase family protein [Ralstonia flatus]|nr:polysaccharide pyruvyl transferase family protein [Ralstonia sp. LMG 32965]MBN6209037.1 polysaccharide pyruvyl transferase family protein [Ralstonia pickettii]
MKILFYLYPGILPQGPDFTGGWTGLFARLARTLGSTTSTGEYFIVTAARFAHHATNLPERAHLRLIDDVALHVAARAIAPLDSTPTALADLARRETDESHPVIRLLNDEIRAACAGFMPDLIVTFSMQAEYLHSIWPEAPILNVEAGAFSRSPFAFSLYFDHMGIYRTSAPAGLPNWNLRDTVAADTLHLAADFRAWASDALSQEDPFRHHDYRAKFDRLALLPLQVSNWYSFDEYCNYKTQFEYLFDVLSAAPKDVGVIATEYVQWGHVFDASHSGTNLEFLRRSFPNLIVPPTARKYASPSQYLVQHVDGVWSVSSNVGYQALLFGKRLGSPLRSFYRNVAHNHTPTEFFANLRYTASAEDRLPFLAWHLERYLVPEALLDNGKWLLQYLDARRTAILGASDPLDAFIPIGDSNEIRAAWNLRPRKGQASRWVSRGLQRLQREAKTEILLTQLENRAQAASHPAALSENGQGDGYILLNDTRAIDQALHLGCNVVTDYIHRQLSATGLRCLGSANTAEECGALLNAPDISKVRLIVFNGEGSLHHDSTRCKALMEFCAHMKQRSVPCVLINTVWHENSDYLGELLSIFDLVTVRESISHSSIQRWRSDVALVPDISFAAFREDLASTDRPPLSLSGSTTPFAVIDNVNADVARTLAEFAEFHRLPYFLMGGLHVDTTVTNGAIAYELNGMVFPRILRSAQTLRQMNAVLTGRFHGLTAALAAGTPVVSLPSNTPKIEGLLKDIGVQNCSLLPADWLQLGHNQRYGAIEAMLANWNSSLLGRVDAWVNAAVGNIDQMFMEIKKMVGADCGTKPAI